MKKSLKIKLVITICIGTLILIIGGILIFSKVISKSNVPVVGIETTSTSYGQEGYFTVYFDNLDNECAAFDVSLEFDPNLIELIGSDKGELCDINGNEVGLLSTSEAYANSEGKFVLVFIDNTGGDQPITASEKTNIAYIRYKTLKPNVEVAVVPLDLHFADTNGETIPTDNFKLISGGITVD